MYEQLLQSALHKAQEDTRQAYMRAKTKVHRKYDVAKQSSTCTDTTSASSNGGRTTHKHIAAMLSTCYNSNVNGCVYRTR